MASDLGGTRRTSRGTASLELVITAPVLFLLLSLIIAFGRYAQTEALVDQAARDAARAATAQNSESEAGTTAVAVANETLGAAPSSCRDSVDVPEPTTDSPFAFDLPDLTDLTAVPTLEVTVSCTIDLSELGPLPLQSITIRRSFVSPLDRYRGYRE